jgi:valyl-tRNA synthetase
MHNIQDWCISRQLWWGHRIPAWYDAEGNIYVGRDEQDARKKNSLVDSIALRQDDDVLDTWFSSALWPFSTQGWPNETEDLEKFYPGQVLVTGFDIIFFWVARMIMMGLKFMGEVPFREVYIHGLIRDQDGQKMSKSKGNVLDPLDLIDGVDLDTLLAKRTTGLMQDHLMPAIEKATRNQFPNGIDAFGTDALRFTFASLATTGRDIRFDLGRIDGYSNFCNKLWNAARYVLMNTESLDAGDVVLSPADRWIRSRLDRSIEAVRNHLDNYRLDLAAQALYEFTWQEFCDWYLELSKPVLQSDDSSEQEKRGTRKTLVEVLETLLRLLHPLMPFITEETWLQVAPRAGVEGDTIMRQAFPEASPANRDDDAEAELEWVMRFILGIRQIRGEMDISPGKPLPVVLENASEGEATMANKHASLLRRVGRVESITRLKEGEKAPASATALLGEMRLLVPMQGLIDVEAERQRLGKQKEKLLTDLDRCRNKLANANFVNNAPAEVVTEENRRAADFQSQISQLDEQISRLASFN